MVWPDVIVFFKPDVDRHLGIFDAVEPLGIEERLAQDTVEAFVIAILPRATWVDLDQPYTDLS